MVSERSPPITTVCPSRAATAVLAERMVVVGPTSVGSPTLAVAVGSMSETSSKRARRTKTNLLVFLTPHIIATDEQMATNSLRERERTRAAMPRALRDRPALTAPSWQPPPAR